MGDRQIQHWRELGYRVCLMGIGNGIRVKGYWGWEGERAMRRLRKSGKREGREMQRLGNPLASEGRERLGV